jgi:hypothetical protein
VTVLAILLELELTEPMPRTPLAALLGRSHGVAVLSSHPLRGRRIAAEKL